MADEAPAAISRKIIGKLSGRHNLKLAAGTLSTIIASKAAGVAAGADTGAFAGAEARPVVPDACAVIAATPGAIMRGLGTAIVTRKILIELEEAMNRVKFGNEILAFQSLKKAEADSKTQISISHANNAG